VLSAGKFNSTESAQLIQIDPVSLKITATINLGSDAVSNLCANSAGDRLYFLQGGVNVMDVQSQVRSKLIEVKNSNFYGMTIDPKTGEIYVADAMDYSQASTVYVFASNGTKLSTFKAGVNANGFYFE
jgi:DNA-binding beta-propeller fold protein YncE